MSDTDTGLDALTRIQRAVGTMPYGAFLPEPVVRDPVIRDGTPVFNLHWDNLAAYLEQLSERLAHQAKVSRDQEAELAKYRRWIATGREILNLLHDDR